MAHPKITKLAFWEAPVRGVLAATSPEQLSKDALWRSENMLYRDGQLRTRPGLQIMPNGVPGRTTEGLPTGAVAYRSQANRPQLLVGGTRGIITYTGNSVRSLTSAQAATGTRPAFSGTLQGDLDHPSRFAQLQIGDFVYAVHSNGKAPLMEWDGEAPFFVPCASDVIPGTATKPTPAPKFKDLAAIGDRIVGLVGPYDVRWGEDLSLALWPQSNFHALAESSDQTVAIRNLGTLGGAIYKSDTIWVIFAEGSTSASFYRFEFRGRYTGPAGPAAIVDVDGTHIYMTRTGRIALFNGSSHQWIADGVWPRIREVIDVTKAHRAFGVYDETQHEVTFYFPRIADRVPGALGPFESGLCRGLVTLSLPQPGQEGILGAFPGFIAPNALVVPGYDLPSTFDIPEVPAMSVSAGAEYKLADEVPRVAVLSSFSATQVFSLGVPADEECTEDTLSPGEGQDYHEPFPFSWETGLQGLGQGDEHYLNAVESFFRRNPNNGFVNAQVTRSYDLSLEAAERAKPWIEDLTERRVDGSTGQHVRARWVGLRYFYEPVTARADGGPNAPRVRWSGALMNGWPLPPAG